MRRRVVTELLNRAFNEASKLPADEQEVLAEWILAEIASEQRWSTALSNSLDPLARLADEALLEHHEKKTQPLDHPER
jgi:hypothetical protein